MILAYRVLTTLLYPFLFLFIYYRKIIKKEDPIRFKEKVLISNFKVNKKENSKLIWFHAASIGEFKSIIPVINQLNINHKNLNFLVTTSTFSSGKLAEVELEKINNADHRYFPYDVPFLIDKFLYLWKPHKIFLVDSEIWPNLILKAKEHKIPIALINARLTFRSFKKWEFFSKAAKKIFGIINLFICSNSETQSYLKKFNLQNVYFKGNIKFIEPIDEKNIKNVNEGVLINKKFWFAASTHEEEDIFCIKTHMKLKEEFEDIITIIAPRHIERSKKIKSLSEKFKLNTQIINENENILENKNVIIVNYFGALTDFFKYAKSVFIGKSMIEKLKNEGGQNPIEAAKLDCKIYHGPYVNNFKDVYKILEINNISKKIGDYKELSSNLALDLKNSKKSNNKKKNLINKLGQKTLTDTMILIDNFIDDKNI